MAWISNVFQSVFFQHIYNPRMPEIGKIGGLSLFNGEKVFYIVKDQTP